MTDRASSNRWRQALARPALRDRPYWRGVLELLEETADRAAPSPDGVGDPSTWAPSRRELLQLMGASIALAGLGACTEGPADQILPYVNQPPEVTPGVPTRYATAMVLDGFATGLLVESHEGRPTKVEGNPAHPASLGATDVYQQASVLGLYDPARARGLRQRTSPASWEFFLTELRRREKRRPPWILMYPQSSSLIGALLDRIRTLHPGTRVAYYTPVDRGAVYRAARQVFGRRLEPHYDFTRAKVVLSLDADFTCSMPNAVRWAHDFAARRRPSGPSGDMSRVYVVEPMLTPTGSLADHRLAVRPDRISIIGAEILAALPASPELPPRPPVGEPAWIRAVARDLDAARGESIVIAGDRQPVEAHVVAHLLNHVLGNFGRTVWLTEPAVLDGDGGDPLPDLVGAIEAREVDSLYILGPNPVYTAPPALELGRWLPQVPHTVHLSTHFNETSRLCQWFVPEAHELESWGDARAFDGTRSFIQPLIEPLYGGKCASEILAALAGVAAPRAYSLLREHWIGQRAADAREPAASYAERRLKESEWDVALRRGLIPDTALERVDAAPQVSRAASFVATALERRRGGGLALDFETSPAVYDGRFASNAWLLELPHPMTKLTWGNAAVISPRTAARYGLDTGDEVELRVGDRRLTAPAMVLPGHADETVTLALGYGRDTPEVALASQIGVDAYVLTRPGSRHVTGLTLAPTGGTRRLAFTQEHWQLRGRPIALHATLEHYRAHPDFTADHRGPQPSLLPRVDYAGDQWAMTIDTTICTGCSACVVACQAENNIPVVGKKGVEQSREMHWLRIDRYFAGDPTNPTVINQPMLCQHCETAPCEYVCPVNATVHSPDGLNEMVYNRCIGTRFCSNNCPYKVRRFNWFEYTEDASATERMQRNPNVTVRERGVMEKCTYCVQRIRGAGIDARNQGRELGPGEVQTACQQACPTRAIQFGSLSHETTEMVRWRREPRRYASLHELGTRPRTLYLAKILNLSPSLDGSAEAPDEHE